MAILEEAGAFGIWCESDETCAKRLFCLNTHLPLKCNTMLICILARTPPYISVSFDSDKVALNNGFATV